MKLLKKLKSYFITEDGQKVSGGANYSWFSRLFGEHNHYSKDPRSYVDLAYGNNPYFFMVIDRIARKAASLPRVLIDTNTNEPIENPTPEQFELKNLLENPNSYEDSVAFYYRLIANNLLGNSYVFSEMAAGFNTGLPAQLISPIAGDVTINDAPRSMNPQSYSFTFRNVAFNNIPPEQTLHMFRPNIICDTYEGLSTLKPSAAVWATSNEIFKSGFALHKNKGVQGVMFGKGSRILTPKEQQQLQARYNTDFGNSDHMGKIYISSSELGYFPMGVNPSDLQSVQMNLDLLRTTCAIFDAPSQLFGDVGASTFSNMGEAKVWFMSNTVLDAAESNDISLNNWLLGPDAGYCYKVYKEQMPEYQIRKKQLTDNTVMLFEKGLITLEEARARLGNDLKEVPEELLNRNNDATEEQQ